MTADQIAISCIILFTFILFIWGRLRYDIVSIISLAILYFFDKILGGEASSLIVETSQLFSGFGHPAVITVAAVLIISRALHNSGVVEVISRLIVPFSKNLITHISSLSGLVSLFSGFMNNVGALALMLPVALKTSVKQNRSPSILLMPLAFASILGGMITMIGTPPNIIISTLRESQYLSLKTQALNDQSSSAYKYLKSQNIDINSFNPEPFGMLDFSPVGGTIAILGVLFVALFGWRLIPKESHKKPGSESLFTINEYVTEVRVPKGCKFIDKNVSEIEILTEEKLTITACITRDGKIYTPRHDKIIHEGDRLQIQSDPVDLKLIMDQFGLRLTKNMCARIDKIKDQNTTYKEVLISPNSPLLNRDRAFFRSHTSNSLVLMVVARRGKPVHKRLGNVIFRVGDVLLLQGNVDNLHDNIRSLNLVPLADREVQVGVFSHVSMALAIFACAIGLSMTGILPTTLAFVCAILLYIFTGILPLREIYQQIDWPIIVLLGAMIPVSSALQTTGSTHLIAEFIVGMTTGLPTWSILAILMIVTMCLSDIINNAATALIMAPISVSIAVSLGLNADPFLMTVAVGASCAFLTPIGHQCNALILGPGGYRFSDYWKMGLPLEILIVILGVPLIQYFWPI